ncbi:MAG: hypothetical protein J4F36_07790 [Nitrosopumilaceae archaeon]|nr:hypothetical protein [Nitrosopumilaceae archaeon]
MNEQRIRINAKQNAKNEWYLDVTVEKSAEQLQASEINVVDVIQYQQEKLRASGFKILGDAPK